MLVFDINVDCTFLWPFLHLDCHDYLEVVVKSHDVDAFSKSESNLSTETLSSIKSFLHNARQGHSQKLQLPDDLAKDFAALWDQSKTIFSLDPTIRNSIVRKDVIVQMDKKERMDFPLSEIREASDNETLSARIIRGNHKLSQIILDGFSTLLNEANSGGVSESAHIESLATLVNPVDDQSLFSMFHYKDGASVPSHEDRGGSCFLRHVYLILVE